MSDEEEANNTKDVCWAFGHAHAKNPWADWTITVECCQDENSTNILKKTYSVHSRILAADSLYFQSLIGSSGARFSENEDRHCTFSNFPGYVVKSFEAFLDCLYKHSSTYRVNDWPQYLKEAQCDDEFFAVLFLLDYFQVGNCAQDCQKAIRYYLDYSRIANLFVGNMEFNVPFLWDAIVWKFQRSGERKWLCEFRSIGSTPYTGYTRIHLLVPKMGIHGVKELLRQFKIRRIEDSNLAAFVAIISQRYFQTMSVADFLDLTHSEMLPAMEIDGALDLLDLLPRFESQNHDNDSIQALKNLQQRCIQCAYENIVFRQTIRHKTPFRLSDGDLTGVIQRALDETSGPQHIPPDRSSKLDLLHETVKQIKVAKFWLAPIELRNTGNHRLSAVEDTLFLCTFVRKEDHYSPEGFKEYRIQKAKSKSETAWEICWMKNSGKEVLVTSSAASEFEGCPPKTGWKRGEKEINITWQF